MSDLNSKFDDLGYDLLDLDTMVYIRAGDITEPEPKECVEHCVKCSVSCFTCGAGCSQGPS